MTGRGKSAGSGSITAAEAWRLAQRGDVQILDLRTRVERRVHGYPPGSRRVTLTRHVLLPRSKGTVYLCQHANRSKLTRWRGAPEIEGGWNGWTAAELPVAGGN